MEFNPENFDYKLVSAQDDVIHYRKISYDEEITFLKKIEIQYWRKADTWIIFIQSENIKQFILDFDTEPQKIVLFIGEIKNDFDFRFIMAKIVKDPRKIAMLGS